MRTRTTLSVNFYCRQTKAGKTGEAPIELGVNVNGSRFFINLPRKCRPKELPKQKEYTSAIEGRIRDYELWCLTRGKKLDADGIKAFIRNGWSIPEENIEYWVNEYMQYTSAKPIRESVKRKHKLVVMQFLEVNDIPLSGTMDLITPGTIRKYNEYLQANYTKSSISGMLQKLKGALQYAEEHNMISKNPFSLKIKRYTPDIQTIDFDEYEKLKSLDLGYCKRLEKVKDLFIFSCNTGLSYTDAQSLESGDFKTNDKGQTYIQKCRNKTGVQYTVVVLPDALEIAKKYGYRLPSISNQKCNSYLKEIEDIARIDINLTFHKARHFYARMLLNKFHFSLEVTARCMGHSNTNQTRHYAKMFSSTVFDAFERI